MASLEGWGSTIELHPRVPDQRNGRAVEPVREAQVSVVKNPSAIVWLPLSSSTSSSSS
jgi:hypothetical protein